MRKFVIALALVALAACAQTPTVGQSIYAADASYNSLAPVAVSAIQSGQIPPAQVAGIKAAFQYAHDTLAAATKAEANGDPNASVLAATAVAAVSDLASALTKAGVK